MTEHDPHVLDYGPMLPPQQAFGPCDRGGTDMHRACARWLREAAATGTLSRTSIDGYGGAVRRWLHHAPDNPLQWKRRHVITWLETMHQPATKRAYLSRLRAFLHWCVTHGILDRDPSEDVPLPKVRRGLPRPYTHCEAARIVAHCRDPRLRAIVLLALHTGLRRAELAALDVTDLDFTRGLVFVRNGKGGKDRQVPLPAEAATAIERYLDVEPAVAGPLFRSRTTGQRIGARYLGQLVTDVLWEVGVKTRPWDGRNTHALRHTAASDVLEVSGRIEVVQALLGHESLNTTLVYSQLRMTPEIVAAVGGRRYG